jgi:hypothetical protein
MLTKPLLLSCVFWLNLNCGIKDSPGVVRVVRNRVLDLHTTRSWDFMGVNPSHSVGILSESRFGEDSIVGVLDTGEAISLHFFLGLGPTFQLED